MVSMFSFRSRSRSRTTKEVDNNVSSGAKKSSSVVKSGSGTTSTTKATPMKTGSRSTTTTTTDLNNNFKEDKMNSTPETLISPLSSQDDHKIIVDNSTSFAGGGGRVLFAMAPSSYSPVSTIHHRKSNNDNNASNNNSRRLSHKSTDCGSSTNSSPESEATTDDDMPFMSAFTRSPPSFDKFDDDDIVGLSNIFPVHNANSEWGTGERRGPWDTDDFLFDEDGDDSADPPVILTQWVSSSSSVSEECEGNENGGVVDNGNAHQSSSIWPMKTRSKKSRVSPSPVSPSSSSTNVDKVANADMSAWCNFGAFGDDFFGSGVDFTSGFVDERENNFPVNVIDDDDNNFFDNSWIDGDKSKLWTTVTRTQTESSASSFVQNGSLSFAYTTSLEEQSITSNALAGDLPPQSQLRNQQQQPQSQHQQHPKVPRPPPIEERKPSTGSSVRNKVSASSSNSVGSSRRGGGGGESVGSNKSNSSAVDQILEHYRRRREANSNGSVHSGSQMTGISHGSGSVVPSTGTTPLTGRSSPSSSSPLVVVTSGTVKNHVAAIRVNNTEYGFQSGPIASQNSNQDTSIDRSTTDLPSSTKSISRSKAPPSRHRQQPTERNIVGVKTDEVMNDNEFLTSMLEATIGPRGIAPDLESLSGRSFTTGRPTRRFDNHRRNGGSSGDSIGSRNSRLTMASHKSFRTYESTKSALTHMSSETRSVANDLFRLEAQLAEQIARQQGDVAREGIERSSAPPKNVTYTTLLGAQPAPRPTSLYTITAPPGKLGILLSNAKSGKVGTHVSAVRSTSVLAGKVHIGDIFESIDGQDVTLKTSKEIMNIMASRSEHERELQLRPTPTESI